MAVKKNRITKKRGPKPSGNALEVRPVRISKDQIAAVKAWAEQQADKPNWSEAVRRLIEIGLASSKS
jgi:hypothetical protein